MLLKGKQINNKYYKCKILINHMKKTKLRIGRVFLLYDNASSHKSKEVRDYLAEQKVKVLPHPPYSPDFVLCDF